MMAPRLLELHRVLKPTGSLYLHCDPTANHYLRMVLDAVFGPINFQNEVVWKRTHAHGSARRYGPVHDTLLFYSRTDRFIWTDPRSEHDPEYIAKYFTLTEPESGRRFQAISLTGAGVRRGDSGKPWRDVDPTSVGRHWALPGALLDRLGISGATPQEKLDGLDARGIIYWPRKAGGTPRLKLYADELEGAALLDIWADVNPVSAHAAERMGYPTQKPLALLERIIGASSNPGDLVLDPFCGCGTAVVAAEKLGRRWIGIDITYIAIDLIISRLAQDFGLKRDKDYQVSGDPKDAYSARKLFEESPKQFEIWAVGLVQGVPQPDKVADKGVDGKVYFQDLEGKLQWAVCQVKGGHLNPSMVRDFAHVIEREKAGLGFLICLETPSKGMYQEAEEAGFFTGPSGRKIPRLQIRTIRELLDERKEFDFPKGYSVKSGPAKRLPRQTDQPPLELK
jgi:site-specific DNA-methyltransferase (adenine-specific)